MRCAAAVLAGGAGKAQQRLPAHPKALQVPACPPVHLFTCSPRAAPALQAGAVRVSSRCRYAMACARSLPHMAAPGCRLAQTAGRPGWPKTRQRWSGPSCTQGTPAGLPCGIPGMALEMDGAVQQAPQPGRHGCAAAVPEKPCFAIQTIAAGACL